MGMLEVENAVIPITGKMVTRFTRLETVSCGHCGAVIMVWIQGCTRTYQSDRTCRRCNTSLCRHCAFQMHQNKGACNPLMAKVEWAIAHGGEWRRNLPWGSEGLQ